MSKRDEILKLEQVLDKADHLYYSLGDSDLSDAQYDALRDKLFILDPQNKRFSNGAQRSTVGTKEKSEAWKTVKHSYKMGSQAKINTFDELKDWCSKNTSSVVVQEKLDGMSIRLEYKNGELVEAVTRGDGEEGLDICKNVLKMYGIPVTIGFRSSLTVRGEILLYKKSMENFDNVKTARNTAVGTAKRLDGKGCEWLNIQVYDILNWKQVGLKTHEECVELLRKLKFDVVNTNFCNNATEVEAVYQKYITSTRSTIDWDIDGLVIKLNTLEDDDWDIPKLSVAYKFPNKESVTKLIDVVWQDSGGRICPVAILEPVIIDGATISRATLNNTDYIKKLGVTIGDIVVVSRRNDVIPCIEKVAIAATSGKSIIPPTHDDEGFPIVRQKNANGDELVYLVSTNPNSKSKRIKRITNWFVQHGVKQIAEATVTSILDAKIASDLPDFMKVCLDGDIRLMDLEGFGKERFKILRQGALKTTATNIIDFLKGIDIQGVGEKTLTAILEHINKPLSLADFVNLFMTNSPDLNNIPNIGDLTIKTIRNEILSVKDIIDSMLKIVTIDVWQGRQIKSTKINGLAFCFTGKMDTDRTTLENMVKDNGGVIAGVSKKLNYLVTNDTTSGSSKNQKVKKLNSEGNNILIISEKDFLNIIS
jgi:DNA ligase (NAD+)